MLETYLLVFAATFWGTVLSFSFYTFIMRLEFFKSLTIKLLKLFIKNPNNISQIHVIFVAVNLAFLSSLHPVILLLTSGFVVIAAMLILLKVEPVWDFNAPDTVTFKNYKQAAEKEFDREEG